MKKYILASITFAVLLFLWSGFTQILPWGVPSAQKITVQASDSNSNLTDLIVAQKNALTTVSFDSTFNDEISTYTTDRTFSWIITQPVRSDYSGYFIGEILTQFLVGVLLTILLSLTLNYSIRTRMKFIVIVGLVAWAATYGQLINWWGMPLKYALGVGVNLLVGWVVTGYLVSRFILKPGK